VGRQVISEPCKGLPFIPAAAEIENPLSPQNLIAGWNTVDSHIPHFFSKYTIDQVYLRITVVSSKAESFEAGKATILQDGF
jgi:hypothetical protein